MKIVLNLLLMVGCTVAANLFMKAGASPSERLILGLVSWKTVAGIIAFACAALVYNWVLKSLPLNVAQAFLAAQFVVVIVASALVLGEPIPLLRWGGIALIGIGIVLVGLTAAGDVRTSDSAPVQLPGSREWPDGLVQGSGTRDRPGSEARVGEEGRANER